MYIYIYMYIWGAAAGTDGLLWNAKCRSCKELWVKNTLIIARNHCSQLASPWRCSIQVCTQPIMGPHGPSWAISDYWLWLALLVSRYLSNATTCVLCFRRVKDHNSPNYCLTLLKKTCVRQVVAPPWEGSLRRVSREDVCSGAPSPTRPQTALRSLLAWYIYIYIYII